MVKIRLLAALQEQVGKEYVEVEEGSLAEVLRRLVEKYPSLKVAIDPEKAEVNPGYVVFVDGMDIRLVNREYRPREVVILPVNHGGEVPESLEVEKTSWDDIERLVSEVSRKIRASGYTPDVVVAIMRGGIVPARLLADELGVDDIAVMEIKLYEGVGKRGRRPYLRQPLVSEIRGRRVLLVDDISDTGLTLQLAVEIVNFYMPEEVKTASLYIKPWTSFIPDYYGKTTEKWVVFPWEKREYERLLSEA